MVQVRNIVNQNPWWKYDDFEDLDKHLSDLKKWPIQFKRGALPLHPQNMYLLRGPRQVGKTTLLKETILDLIRDGVDPGSILYYPCDYLHSRKELRRVIDYHLDRNRTAENLYIFLDEITYLQDWSREIKSQADLGILDRGTLVLTGSGAAHLKREAEQLPGRGLEKNQYLLLPLTFREFVLQASALISSHLRKELRRALDGVRKRLKGTILSLEEDIGKQREIFERIIPYAHDLELLFRTYLLTGGFPLAINRYIAEGLESIHGEAYSTLTQTILGDFSKRGREEALARQILEGIALRYGTRYNYLALTDDVDATHPTVKSYLDAMDDSLLTQTVHSIDVQTGRARYKAQKKIYFTDPFLFHSVNAFVKGMDGFPLSIEAVEEEASLSSLVEGVVASHLTQTRIEPYLVEPITFLFFFYSTRKEVDFVFRRRSGEFTGIEVKYGIGERTVRFPRVSQLKEKLVLTRESADFRKEEMRIPVAVLLTLLEKSKYCL